MKTEMQSECIASRVGEHTLRLEIHQCLVLLDDKGVILHREKLPATIKDIAIPTKFSDADLARYAKAAMKAMHEMEKKALEDARDQLRRADNDEAKIREN